MAELALTNPTQLKALTPETAPNFNEMSRIRQARIGQRIVSLTHKFFETLQERKSSFIELHHHSDMSLTAVVDDPWMAELGESDKPAFITWQRNGFDAHKEDESYKEVIVSGINDKEFEITKPESSLPIGRYVLSKEISFSWLEPMPVTTEKLVKVPTSDKLLETSADQVVEIVQVNQPRPSTAAEVALAKKTVENARNLVIWERQQEQEAA